METTLSNILTVPNLLLVLSVIGGWLLLRSGTVKQLIENLKQLGSVQETLLKTKDKEIEDLKKDVERLEMELKEEKKENKRLRDYDYESREEIAKLKRTGGETAQKTEPKE